jgi:hypothetical protein
MAGFFPVYGQHANVYISTGTYTAPTNSTIVTTSFGAWTSVAKDVKITGGERNAETIKLLGYNETIDLKRATPIECQMTFQFNDADTVGTDSLKEMIAGTRTTPTTGLTRVQFGEKSSGDRAARAILIQFVDGSNTLTYLLNSSYMTNQETTVIADEQVEMSVTFKCLASNCYYEEKIA